MEGAPFKSEDDSGKTDKPRKKKTRPEAFGAFLTEPKAEKSPPSDGDATKQWFEKLYNGDKKAETAEAAAADVDHEITTPEEDQFIAEQVVAVQPETDHQLIEAFRDKIIGEHLDPLAAEIETLQEFGIVEPEPQTVAPPAAENTEITIMELSPTSEKIIHLEHQSMSTSPPIEHPAADFSAQEQQTRSVRAAAGQAESSRVDRENDRDSATHPTGLVDYLVGRRRGRLKAEKRLGKVQKRMEQRVTAIQQDLLGKEARLRRVDTRQIRQRDKIARLERADRRSRYAQAATEQRVQRIAAPEARRLHVAAPPERIGRAVIRAESARPEYQPRRQRIETMPHSELVALSETIPAANSNLRRIYETHLISEQGLRRLVETHEAGGNLKKALSQEIMEHDIDFERDPMMRDRRQPSAIVARSAQASIDSVISKAIEDDHARDEVAVLRAQAAYETAEQSRQRSQRQLMDIGLVGTIMLLTAAIIILLLGR